MLTSELQAKYEQVGSIIRSLESVAVAFSAGVDSTLVLKIALDALGADRVVAATGRSDSLAADEFDESRRLAEQLGVRHAVLDTQEFENENYLANPHNRCYYCKTTLYARLSRFITDHGLRAIVNGVNADDLQDWRPGLQAATEHGVRAPLAEAGVTKQEVRLLSEQLGLPTFAKPASPCLSSRVQYGERITPQKLRMIEQAESFLRSLGVRECRVRHHDNLARIEVNPPHIERLAAPGVREQVEARLRELGYQYVTLDLRGFRSGSMNEVVSVRIVR